RLPPLIREFRAAAQNVELLLVELETPEQVGALKEGKIDVGFGHIRFEDEAVRRIVLREERLVAAIPAIHPMAAGEAAVSLTDLARQPLILYPRQPSPSFADQVIRLFHDRGLEPRVSHEVREAQTALGLVAAEEGVTIVPEFMRKSHIDGVTYRDLIEPAASPLIMSHRAGDHSPELQLMAAVIVRMYSKWGYHVPEGVTRLADPS
ncbi:MAG: LysR family transcriptional regulator, partial [Hyphomicrobiales bacterium]|nr:LysR family transcriptional regulator [Hyphomicrobiales bacterium]